MFFSIEMSSADSLPSGFAATFAQKGRGASVCQQSLLAHFPVCLSLYLFQEPVEHGGDLRPSSVAPGVDDGLAVRVGADAVDDAELVESLDSVHGVIGNVRLVGEEVGLKRNIYLFIIDTVH